MLQDCCEPFDSNARIVTIDRRRMSETDACMIAELLCKVWPQSGRIIQTRLAEMRSAWQDYRGPEAQFPRSFIIRSAGRAVAHAEISPRTIRTIAGEITIGALAGVCTDPSVRGSGLGVRMVREAFGLVDDGTFPFALFQNYIDKRPFYEKLGARSIDNPIINSRGEDPRTNPFWADVAMVYPATKTWPRGEIDLCGPGY